MSDVTMEQLVEEMRSMHTRVQPAEQRTAVAERAAFAAQAANAERAQPGAVAAPLARPLVDTHTLGRPRGFKSVRGGMNDWSFAFRAFLAGASA
eukprot:640280-Amphidinium_carterae.1